MSVIHRQHISNSSMSAVFISAALFTMPVYASSSLESIVPLRRGVVEEMLRERFEKKLQTLNDEELARLLEEMLTQSSFPTKILQPLSSTPSFTDKVTKSVKPLEPVLVQPRVGDEKDEQEEDLTRSLLSTVKEQNKIEKSSEVKNTLSELRKDITERLKDVFYDLPLPQIAALIVAAGLGGLFLGESTSDGTEGPQASVPTEKPKESHWYEFFPQNVLGWKNDDVRDPEDQGAAPATPPPPPSPPTVMPAGTRTPVTESNGVLWRRKEEMIGNAEASTDKEDSSQPLEPVDLWRVPLHSLIEKQQDSISVAENDIEENYPKKHNDILDNAEPEGFNGTRSRRLTIKPQPR